MRGRGGTAGGDRSSRQAIYRARRRNPRALIVATGCYAQIKPQELASLKEVDLVVGNTHKGEILKLVEEALEKRERKVVVGEIFRQKDLQSFGTVLYFEGTRPFLKVQEGCNKFCTFCVIPYARGKVRSADPEKIRKQVEQIAEMGFQEVVLTGTQLSQYGWDRGTSLRSLLLRLLEVKGIEIFRLSSLHIDELDPLPPFPSERIRQDLERGYTRDEFVRTVERILSGRPHSAIGTDVIVGFPTETEEDFRETLSLIEEIPFAYLHLFPYSDRPFTKASRMRGKVPERIKKERPPKAQGLLREKQGQEAQGCGSG